MESKPVIGIHRVLLEEQGEKCQICKKVQTTYISVELPTRVTLCFTCAIAFLKSKFPAQTTTLLKLFNEAKTLKDAVTSMFNTVGGLIGGFNEGAKKG